jgi:hypothetical protein
MHKLSYNKSSVYRVRLLAVCVAVLLGLAWSVKIAAADPGPTPVGPEQCAACHPTQMTLWEDSPHAHALETVERASETACSGEAPFMDCECFECHTTGYDQRQGSYTHAGVTCEACHGPYIPDHPQAGLMQLEVDSSTCRDCHTVTYEQWQETAHSEANVQCTGCHVAHSQETRLERETLCQSCHAEEESDWAHHTAGVNCTDCHVSSPGRTGATNAVSLVGGSTAPNHSFGLVVHSCADCHAESIHTTIQAGTTVVDQAQLAVMQQRVKQLGQELEEAKKAHSSMATMSVVALGFGLGAGGIVGVIFSMILGYILHRRAQDE